MSLVRTKPVSSRATRVVTRHPAFNADLYASLKQAAIDADETISDRLHAILCHALDRSDLLPHSPGKLARDSG